MIKGFAGVKLSGSLNIYGYWRIIIKKSEREIINPKRSLRVGGWKVGEWKGILYRSLFILVDLRIQLNVGKIGELK